MNVDEKNVGKSQTIQQGLSRGHSQISGEWQAQYYEKKNDFSQKANVSTFIKTTRRFWTNDEFARKIALLCQQMNRLGQYFLNLATTLPDPFPNFPKDIRQVVIESHQP